MKKTAKPVPTGTKDILSVRISSDLKRRLHGACGAGPYKLSVTALVERGLELAIKELNELKFERSQ